MNIRVFPGLVMTAMTVLLSLSFLSLNGLPTHAQAMGTLTVTDCSSDQQLQDDIANAASGDTSTFTCSGTIPLSQTLTITKNLTLDGSGQNVTLSGQNQVRVLFIRKVSFTLNALTIANGASDYGGGLRNDYGTVTIATSTFSNNTATIGGAIYGGGPTDIGVIPTGDTTGITTSTFSNNEARYGGAIYNDYVSTMIISNSTISGNRASYQGGGIQNRGSKMTITTSTIANNTAAFGGGGLANAGSTMAIATSTIFGNSVQSSDPNLSGGAALMNEGKMVTISNSTIANNAAPGGSQGSLWNRKAYDKYGTLQVRASIVANNPGGNCSNSRTITNRGYNLESGTDCGFTAYVSQQNTDPKLDPAGLTDNGGPTQTIALQPDSPALNKIPASNPNVSITYGCPLTGGTDQRGMPRPGTTVQGLPAPLCDIGAYETQDKPSS